MDILVYYKNTISAQMSLIEDFDLIQDDDRSFKQEMRSTSCHGITTAYKVHCYTLLITVNSDDGILCELFIHPDQEGGGCRANLEGLGRLTSLCLRHKIQITEIFNQLKGIRCPAVSHSLAKGNTFDALSCPDAICRAIIEFVGANDGALTESFSGQDCQRCQDI